MALIDVIEASGDSSLRMRFIAAAAIEGIKDPQTWQYEKRYELLAAPIGEGATDTITSVYVYARDGAKVEAPGLDPTIVTDEYVINAVRAVRAAEAV